MKRILLGVLAGLLLSTVAHAENVSVAVAANFTKVAEALAPLFKAETGHDVTYSFGATGQLYTQITQGAPFEVFLAADDVRPAQAVTEGFIRPQHRALVIAESDPDHLLDRLAAFRPPAVAKWIDRDET